MPEPPTFEPWLDRRKLADYLSCSVRLVEIWLDEGMPYVVLGGRKKFRASEIEVWLEQNGHLVRGSTLNGNEKRPDDATNATRP
jgi:phage terminase Nu1 subunit (DNA packaging protein)